MHDLPLIEPRTHRWSALGEVNFDWVLEGTAIQDVFIIPARRQHGISYPRGNSVAA